MALIDKASLLMVPSTYEAGKLYNVLPSGNRAPDSTDQNSGYDQTRADFDFDRGTDHAATRIDENGVLQKYRENLLLRSNQFDTTWATISSTETGGQADKDGGTDAWKIERVGTGGYIYQDVSRTGVNTISVYAKAGTLNWMRLRVGSAPKNSRYFDLENGVIGTDGGAPVDAKIESVGNGWYRCIMTTNISVNRVWFYPVPNDGDISGSSGSIFIQSAQLETGLVATDVLTSGATTAKAGVLVDMPRINYDANGENGALLLEPSRQNLVVYSEYLNGGIWIQTGSSVTDNDSTSPEGLTNAAKVEGDGSQTYIRLYDNLTFPSTGNYTLSVFAKAGNNDFLRLVFGGVTGGNEAYFDLVNGTTEETWASIEPVGTDGWYRCSITADLTGPDLTGNYNSYVSYSYTDRNFPSAGDANGQYVYLYGFQVEANATYPSSYIPNNGESGGVTRAADSCSVTGASDVIGQSEGTIFAEFKFNANQGMAFQIAESNGYSNAIYLERSGNTSMILNCYVSGVSQVGITLGSMVDGQTYKVAVSYKLNDFAVYRNGYLIGTDNSATIPASLNNLYIGSYGGASGFELPISQATLFKERLSNAELAALTA